MFHREKRMTHRPTPAYQRLWLWIAAAMLAVSFGLYAFLAASSAPLPQEVVATTTHDLVPETLRPAEAAGEATIDYDPDGPQAPTF